MKPIETFELNPESPALTWGLLGISMHIAGVSEHDIKVHMSKSFLLCAMQRSCKVHILDGCAVVVETFNTD